MNKTNLEESSIVKAFNVEEPRTGQKRIRVEDLLNPDGPEKLDTKRDVKPIRMRKSTQPPIPIAKDPFSIKSIANIPNINVSLAQLADISPGFRSDLKKLITKSRPSKEKKKGKIATTSGYFADHVDNGAPRTLVRIKNYETSCVLDGGSVANIASLDFISKIGYTTLIPSRREYVFANGSKAYSLGLLHDLPVTINDNTLLVSVSVFDHRDYTILLGRYALREFGIGTDWKEMKWWIKEADNTKPLNVFYDSSYMIKRITENYDEDVSENSEEEGDSDSEEEEDDVEEVDGIDGYETFLLIPSYNEICNQPNEVLGVSRC